MAFCLAGPSRNDRHWLAPPLTSGESARSWIIGRMIHVLDPTAMAFAQRPLISRQCFSNSRRAAISRSSVMRRCCADCISWSNKPKACCAWANTSALIAALSKPFRSSLASISRGGVSIFAPFGGGAPAAYLHHGSALRRHSRTIHSLQQGSNRVAAVDLQGFLLQPTIAQDLPRQLHQIQNPEPLDVGPGADVLKDHLANQLEFAPVFTRQQTRWLLKGLEFGRYRESSSRSVHLLAAPCEISGATGSTRPNAPRRRTASPATVLLRPQAGSPLTFAHQALSLPERCSS